jgi:outer membrane lipoprotein SlyB
LKPLFAITALPVHGYYLMPFEGGGTAQEFAAWVGALCERVAGVGLREAMAVSR